MQQCDSFVLLVKPLFVSSTLFEIFSLLHREEHDNKSLKKSNQYMSNGGRAPSFSGRGGGRISSLQAHDLSEPAQGRGRGGGRFGRNQGRGKKVLNGNFMNQRDKGGAGATAAEETNAKVQRCSIPTIIQDLSHSDQNSNFAADSGKI
jgi:hypothetical protein